MLRKRASGILLHVTSLPSKYGIGDLGPQAYKFVDFLASSSQSYWQILPLTYTTAKTDYSPYNCFSAFAGNPLLISPDLLRQDRLLTKDDIQNPPSFPQTRVNFDKIVRYKTKLFKVAFRCFRRSPGNQEYDKFCDENSFWLEDFATFQALTHHIGNRSWCDWPEELKNRKGRRLRAIKEHLGDNIGQERFLQYVFHKQWKQLKHYCNERGIQIIGDIPIYVAYHSPDVWAEPKNFKLDRDKKPKHIAGVPPDYFSRTGQLWGNPVYDWQFLKKTNYLWWMNRMRHNLTMFDLVRIDHFRGLISYWQVPAGHKTALHGTWVDGPKYDFFRMLLRHFPTAPIIAEDLGYITSDVREVIEKFTLPTMKVLQFAFDGNSYANPHIPHNHIENCIVYTGTHDNNTTKGWFEKEATRTQKKRLNEYLGQKVSGRQIHWQFIRLAMSSVAKLAIIPVQDILGLSDIARMNHPAAKKGNWLWRLKPGQLNVTLSSKLKQLTKIMERD